jgi:cysteine synthase A
MQLQAPLVPLTEIGEGLYAKVEYLHPSGSIKHRAIPPLIEARKRAGDIRPGQRIAVPSAGAAAVAAAWAAARIGHPSVAILPRTAPPQILRLLRWLGARCEQVDAVELPSLMLRLKADPGTYLLSAGSDGAVPEHYRPVAREILDGLPEVEAITVGIGTGATITGIGRELRAATSACRLVGVEPAEAQVAIGRPWSPHGIFGLAPPVPQVLLDRGLLSETIPVGTAEAWQTAQMVHRRSGLPIGPSAGAAVAAALALRARGVSGAIVAVCSCSIAEYVDAAPVAEEPCPSPA